MTENVGDIEEKYREGRIRRTRKDVLGCVKDVVVDKNVLVQF